MTMPDHQPQVIVVGGGITGLCCLHRLQALGVPALLLEAGDRVGGRIQTMIEDGFEFEAGPNTLLSNNPAMITLLDELEMQSAIIDAAPAAKHRYVLYHGRLEPVPMNPLAALTSPLLGVAGIFQAMGDLFRKPALDASTDESVSSFIRRRFGPRVLNNLVTPFLSGVYAGDPDKLEARAVLKLLVAAEERSGSVIRGLIAARREKRRNGEPKRPKTRSITFRGGLQALPKRLSAVLGERIRTGAKVVTIEQDAHGCRLMLDNGKGFDCQRVVIATETPVAARLVTGLSGGETVASDLRAIRSSGVAVVGMAYKRSAIAHPLDGFGFLSGPGTQGPLLGCLFRSSIFPHAAPPETPLLVCFLGGARHDLSNLADADIVQLARSNVTSLLGLSGEPARIFFKRWHEAIPQSEIGHTQRIRRIVEWSIASRISIISSGVFGAPLPQCIATAREEAERLAPLLASMSPASHEAVTC